MHWIKLDKQLFHDPKIARIATALGVRRHEAVGLVAHAWAYFDTHSTDGTIEFGTPDMVDQYVGRHGVAEAMASVGWLDWNDKHLVMPDFDKHMGQSAKRRAVDRERQRRCRDV